MFKELRRWTNEYTKMVPNVRLATKGKGKAYGKNS